jgi:class 3 adenylate cyclase
VGDGKSDMSAPPAASGRPKLSTVITLSFICLSIPVLIFILLFGYRRNAAGIISILDQQMQSAHQASVENANGLIDPAAGALRLLAEMAVSDPGLFKSEHSRELLYRALISAPQVDAVYVTFSDGYERVVTRIDDDRRRSDPRIPPNAVWHSSYIDAFSAGPERARHRTFFDVWPHVVGHYSVETTVDVAGQPSCRTAKETGSLAVDGPSINPDTGSPVLSLAFPIEYGGYFIGCSGANITLNVLSRFLKSHSVSARSTTLIADWRDGEIIADSERRRAVRTIHDHLEVATLYDIPDADVRAAYQRHLQTEKDDFVFLSPESGKEFSVSFTPFPADMGLPWETIILAPTDDFVKTLKATNRTMIVVIVLLTVIEALLIRLLAGRLSRPIETISRELRSIETLALDDPPANLVPSGIREIEHLRSAASLLRSSLQSFASFVPLEVVRQLIRSGAALSLGAEPRSLTIFFSDLEDFSTHSERLPPDALLSQMSTYFETVSNAISEEHGTVDKFIGDGVMAFWGAPLPRSDHVLRACAGALRAARRMDRVNEEWTKEGREQMRLRIGLNCANVLVGNFGSSERLSYTVMGDGVNVAARLEGVNKLFGTTICISDAVLADAGSTVLARPLRTVRVKGRSNAFMVYELLGIKKSHDPELAVDPEAAKLCEMTWDASAYFERGDVTEAARRYRLILEAFPHDPVARSLLHGIGGPTTEIAEMADGLAGAGQA